MCKKAYIIHPKSDFYSTQIKNNLVKAKNHTVAIISHASKFTVKFLQARLQQYVNQELPDVLAGEVEEPEIKLPTFVGS